MTAQLDVQNLQRLERAVARVLDSLDRQDERLNGHSCTQREHTRHGLRMMASVILPAVDPQSEPQKLKVWVRNISPSGLSFIYPELIDSKSLVVGINNPNGSITWFNAEVMRSRKASEDFWEYGLAFRERATTQG